MNQSQRNLMAQGIMAVAICLGAYMIFVEPVRPRIAEAMAQGQDLAARVQEAELLSDQLPRMTDTLENKRREAEALSRQGELAREERKLFSSIMAAAERHRIQVDSLNPASQGSMRGPVDPAASRDKVVAYSISASGQYRNVARFVRSLQSELGFAGVRSVIVTPKDEGETVRVMIETVHFYFDPAPLGPGGERMAGAEGGL